MNIGQLFAVIVSSSALLGTGVGFGVNLGKINTNEAKIEDTRSNLNHVESLQSSQRGRHDHDVERIEDKIDEFRAEFHEFSRQMMVQARR